MFTSIFEKLKCNWLNLLKLKFRIYLPCASLLFTHTKAATGPKNHSCHRINCWMVQNDFLMCKYELKFFYYKNTGLNQSIWILIFILFEDQRVRVKQWCSHSHVHSPHTCTSRACGTLRTKAQHSCPASHLAGRHSAASVLHCTQSLL